MFMLYVACIIIFAHSSFLVSMDIVPHNQSMIYFRTTRNADVNKGAVELKTLNVQNESKQNEPLQQSLTMKKSDYKNLLYRKIKSFFDCLHPEYQNLIECINASNYAKGYGINEDQMGIFAFNQDNLHTGQSSSLFFYLLKHYNKRVAITREVPYKTWSPLAKRLNLIPDADHNVTTIELLINDVNKLLLDQIPHYDEFIFFIHSKQKCNELHENMQLDGEWKKQFLYDAFKFLCADNVLDQLYDLVIMLTAAKKQGVIQQESDVGYYALSYTPTLMDKMLMKPLSVSYDSQKEKISLLCSFIAKYNTKRGEKITPTPSLYQMYKTRISLHMLMPDSFDEDLLDPTIIAFVEYAELLDDIIALCSTHADTIEDCVKTLYNQPFK